MRGHCFGVFDSSSWRGLPIRLASPRFDSDVWLILFLYPAFDTRFADSLVTAGDPCMSCFLSRVSVKSWINVDQRIPWKSVLLRGKEDWGEKVINSAPLKFCSRHVFSVFIGAYLRMSRKSAIGKGKQRCFPLREIEVRSEDVVTDSHVAILRGSSWKQATDTSLRRNSAISGVNCSDTILKSHGSSNNCRSASRVASFSHTARNKTNRRCRVSHARQNKKKEKKRKWNTEKPYFKDATYSNQNSIYRTNAALLNHRC